MLVRKTTMLLDWTDEAFEGAITIDGVKLDNIPTAAKGCYLPIFVEAPFGAKIWLNWEGVGPSPVPFKMKAYVDDKGRIYKPARRERDKFEPFRYGYLAYVY